jgi:hypothetical protein
MSNAGPGNFGMADQDSGRPLDGKVVVLENGTEWAVLEYEGAGRYLVKSADHHKAVLGSVSDLLVMGLADPGGARYRVYYPAGETADVRTPEKVAIRLGGHQAVLRDGKPSSGNDPRTRDASR